jgi:hypothetical protein
MFVSSHGLSISTQKVPASDDIGSDLIAIR